MEETQQNTVECIMSQVAKTRSKSLCETWKISLSLITGHFIVSFCYSTSTCARSRPAHPHRLLHPKVRVAASGRIGDGRQEDTYS